MSGDVDMRAMIESIRKLGELPEEAAKLGAPLIEDAAKVTAKAGKSPDGEAWAPLKKGGGNALAKAADAIKAAAIGAVIRLTLEWPYSLHQIGKGHAEKREVIPVTGRAMPTAFGKALLDAARKAFLTIVGNRRG